MTSLKDCGKSIRIRSATNSDLVTLAKIHNHYVRDSNITLNEKQRSELGCAFSSAYRQHPAFRQTVETSIYLHPSARGQSIGTALYTVLFEILEQEDVHRVVVGIALPNPASVALHKRFGFRAVGVFDEYATKNDQRISSVLLEKAMDGAW